MTTDTILHKYLRHLRHMNGGGYVSMDAVELALRLALDDLAESTPSTPSTELVALQKDQLAALQSELEQLQADADAEVADLRSQLAQLDTDNAAMIRRNRELADQAMKLIRPLRVWIASSYPRHAIITADEELGKMVVRLANEMNHEIANLRRQIATLQAEIANLTAYTDTPLATNGAATENGATAAAPSAISNQQSPINNSMWSDPNMLQLLDDEATDWWIGCAAGRHQWRAVPKPVQLRMVRHVLSYGPETGSMKMIEFDAVKPDWMPGSGSHTKTLSLSWQQLNDWSIEL